MNRTIQRLLAAARPGYHAVHRKDCLHGGYLTGVFTPLSTSGSARDICAELA
jgi:hypothetical protein